MKEIAKTELVLPIEIEYEQEENGKYSCHVLYYDIYFTASKQEDIIKRGEILVSMFVKFFVDENNDKKTSE